MNEGTYYNTNLLQAARQFAVRQDDVQFLIRRGALDAVFRDGHWWIHLGPRRGEVTLVYLWHGTSRDRVGAIVERGLRTETRGNQIWLTTNELRARVHAISRAQRRRGLPVLVGCEVDLGRYPIFWRPSRQVYVFHQPLGPEVVKSVQEVDEREQSRRFRMEMKRRARKKSTNVGVTKNSGPLGILFWVNTYLQMQGLEPVTMEHRIARGVIEWVEQEYRHGRDDPIIDDELAERTARLLPDWGGSR